MGQRATRTAETSSSKSPALKLSIFATEMGWIGLLGSAGRLACLTVGHATGDKVRQEIQHRFGGFAADGFSADDFPVELDWSPVLRKRLERYCSGAAAEFADVALHHPRQTPFQERVMAITRKIPFGSTVSYGELARRAGYPRAARAVGTVMSSNRFPIVVPCHRVVQSGGRIGEYTGPRGKELKERLLAMEAGAVAVEVG